MVSMEFRKYLADLFISTGLLKFQENIINNLSCKEQLPFFVILNFNRHIRQSFQRILPSTLSQAKWLLILEKDFDIKKYFDGLRIPFDTEFILALRLGERYKLIELYQISSEQSLIMTNIGDWDFNNRSSWIFPSIYRRRNNLQGSTLNITTLEYPPMLTLDGKGFGGFFGIVWSHLEKTLNFKTKFKPPPDKAWGTIDKNGTWNGMIAQLLSGEADVGVNAFTMTKSRLSAVDFSAPVIYTSICIFVALQQSRDFSWTDYVKPFSAPLWLAVGVCIAGVSLCLPLLHHAASRLGHSAHEPQCHNPVVTLFYVFGIFCQQGHDVTPESLGCRVLYFTAYVTAVIVLAAYSAGLIAFLTVIKLPVPFVDFQSLLDLGTYRLGMADKSGVLNVFDNATEPLLKKIYRKLILPGINNLPKNQEEVVSRLCSSKYAYMRSRILGVRDESGDCSVVPIPQASLPETLALAFPKNSSFRGLLNVVLQRYKEIGVLKRIESEVWPPVARFEDNAYTTVGFDKVIPVFVVLSVGLALSLIFFCLEYAKVLPIAKVQELCYGEEHGPGVYEAQEGLFASTAVSAGQSARSQLDRAAAGEGLTEDSSRMGTSTEKYWASGEQGSAGSSYS